MRMRRGFHRGGDSSVDADVWASSFYDTRDPDSRVWALEVEKSLDDAGPATPCTPLQERASARHSMEKRKERC